MSFYRSDEVKHYKLILPRESAWEIMDKLGTPTPIQVSTRSSTSSPPTLQSSRAPSSPRSDASRTPSCICAVWRAYWSSRGCTAGGTRSRNRRMSRFIACGSPNTKRSMRIPSTSSTKSSGRSTTPGSTTRNCSNTRSSWRPRCSTTATTSPCSRLERPSSARPSSRTARGGRSSWAGSSPKAPR